MSNSKEIISEMEKETNDEVNISIVLERNPEKMFIRVSKDIISRKKQVEEEVEDEIEEEVVPDVVEIEDEKLNCYFVNVLRQFFRQIMECIPRRVRRMRQR
ncbi:Hypothetical protein CINCED_3A020769 [Cinara cedri]|uniref:Uncharacterized protein n=1 Tax=Cinara cedri TaxID=506608 RepID=A0A5E4M091_9HEMI|nr:Hypothetical protein CINCED_3A020769 [Cinara cedri]